MSSCFGHGGRIELGFRQVGYSSEILINHFIRNSGEQIIRKSDDQNRQKLMIFHQKYHQIHQK
ncbi:hypothetical protein HanRHA438_Chr04g0165121 [Helianthus annuus]|nr:hypothetical protein HanRHA438_Chr04g0165121 [Helianthus annuus]